MKSTIIFDEMMRAFHKRDMRALQEIAARGKAERTALVVMMQAIEKYSTGLMYTAEDLRYAKEVLEALGE